MLRRIYDRLLALAAGPRAAVWLAVVAFAESSVFPLPPDTLLIPMVVARPKRAWWYASICTVASVAGGLLGYAIGAWLLVPLALPIIRFYHYEAGFASFQAKFAQYGLWVILVKGLTPIPYKIVTIASGAAHFDLGVFVLASAATRGLRFFLVAGLLRVFGEKVRLFVERRLTLVTGVAAACLVGGFLALRFL